MSKERKPKLIFTTEQRLDYAKLMGGATSYQLYKSLHSNFAGFSVVYSGTSTSTWINIPSGTWYLRVKACNAAGCSSLSVKNQQHTLSIVCN